jgi:UDP-N-acetylmuramate-alanine ligase
MRLRLAHAPAAVQSTKAGATATGGQRRVVASFSSTSCSRVRAFDRSW